MAVSAPLFHRIIRVQRGLCYLCGVKMTAPAKPYLGTPKKSAYTRDHVWPKALGGGCDRNILAACRVCNTAKGDRPPRVCEEIFLSAVNERIEAGSA
jgi:5-methylcytosine-specific restriction endonuclease McrA